MTVPAEITCKLTQDLLVGYVAGEVSPETRDWVTRHLDQCAPCRQALAQYTGVDLPPAAPPSSDPGRRLFSRLRKGALVILAVVLGSLVLAGGAVWWAMTYGRQAADLPAEMPVPPAAMSPGEVAVVVPPPTGLTVTRVTDARDGVKVNYDNGAHYELRKYPSAREAADGFDAWYRSFRIKTLSVSYGEPNHITKFRSEGHLYYAWADENWVVIVGVPDSVKEAAAVRDQIRDHLTAHISTLR